MKSHFWRSALQVGMSASGPTAGSPRLIRLNKAGKPVVPHILHYLNAHTQAEHWWISILAPMQKCGRSFAVSLEPCKATFDRGLLGSTPRSHWEESLPVVVWRASPGWVLTLAFHQMFLRYSREQIKLSSEALASQHSHEVLVSEWIEASCFDHKSYNENVPFTWKIFYPINWISNNFTEA